MSHISTMKLEIKDLDAMAEAAKELGLELDVNAKQFRNYGGRLDKCDAVLRVRGNAHAYEAGLRLQKDGTYSLAYDPFIGGLGMQACLSHDNGRDANKLQQAYAQAVAERQLKKQGFRVQRKREGNKVRLVATR